MKNQGGRPSKGEIVERREKVKELYLKGKTIGAISKALNVSYPAIEADVRYLQARYTKMVINNPYLAEKQFSKVEQLLDEVGIIKSEYWDVYTELQEKVAESKKIMAQWEADVKTAKTRLEEAEESKDPKAIRQARKALDYVSRPPRLSTYVTARIDTLKALLDRVDKESKLLSLFNPQQLIDRNYVSVEVMRSIMEIFKGIILDLIPEDKRSYAFKRLRTIDVQALKTEEVVDAVILDERPKDVKRADPVKPEEPKDDEGSVSLDDVEL
jgi:ElaB/YqjD/DUF883 family membrane-anchored ribosome-binding protein